MSNTASDAVSRAGARMTAWCSGPPSAPTELGKNDGEECRRPGRRGDTRASGHEGPPRAHGEDGCAGIAARPVLRGRDPPVRMRRTRRRCTRCRCIGRVDELVVDGVGEEVRRAWGDRPRAAKRLQGRIADAASRSAASRELPRTGSIPTGSHSPKCGCDPPGSNCRFTQALGGPAFLTDGNEWHVRVSHRSPSLSLSALSIGALCSLSQSCQSVT